MSLDIATPLEGNVTLVKNHHPNWLLILLPCSNSLPCAWYDTFKLFLHLLLPPRTFKTCHNLLSIPIYFSLLPISQGDLPPCSSALCVRLILTSGLHACFSSSYSDLSVSVCLPSCLLFKVRLKSHFFIQHFLMISTSNCVILWRQWIQVV